MSVQNQYQSEHERIVAIENTLTSLEARFMSMESRLSLSRTPLSLNIPTPLLPLPISNFVLGGETELKNLIQECLSSVTAKDVAGSFIITECVTNGVFRVSGVAGKDMAGKTIEIFNSSGRKVAEAGTVDANGNFTGTVGPPNPFRVGATVIVRIGNHVSRCVAE